MEKKIHHILLVEDEEAHAELVCESLESASSQFSVTVAGSVEEAKAVLAESNVSLAIVDWSLPDGKGSELLPGSLDEAVLPMIMMTAHGDEGLAVEVMKAGALDYVVKSADTISDMRHIVERSLREWEYITERRRAEEALRESENRFRTLVELAPMAIYETDAQGSCLYVNEKWRELSGLTLEEALGDGWKEGLHKDDRARVFQLWTEHSQDQVPWDMDYRFCTPEGKVSWVIGKATAMRDTDGQVTGYLGANVDITERKRAEEALRESEKKYRNLVEMSQDLIWKCDSEGRFTYLNRAWEDTLGYTEEEMIGHEFAEFKPSDAVEKDAETFTSILKGGKAYGYETTYVSKSGERKILLFNAQVLRDDSGAVLGTQGTAHDITERKRAEEKIGFLSQIIEQVADSFIATDLDYRITYANRAFEELYGHSREEIIGLSPDVLNAEPDCEMIQKQIYETVSSGETWRGEALNRRKDGSTFPIEMVIFPLLDEHGRTFAYAGTLRDITERKHAEAALRESEERFRTIYENAPVLIDAFDENGRCVLWNEQCRKTFGWTIDEINEHDDALAVFYPDPAVRDEVRLTVTTEPHGHFREWHPTTKGGKTLTTMWANFRLPDGMAFNLGYDITESKRAEEALRASEEKYRVLVERNPYGIQEMDAYGTITFANEMHQEMYGYGKEHLIGRSITEFLKPGPQRDELPGYLDMLANDQPLPTIYRQTILTKDGRERSIDVCWNYRRDATGSVTGFISVLTDVTARMRAEEALKEQMQLTQILLDSMPCIAMLLRPHSREIVALNQAARDAGAALGKTCFATWPEFDEPCPWCMAPEQWASGEERHLEIEGIGVMWDTHWIPVSDDLYMHYAFDITERKRAEQQTENSLKEKEVLLREIHHRVKNNMQVIVSMLRMHARRSQSLQIQEIFEDCQERVGAMALIHETLYQSEDLARIDFEVYLKKLCQNMVRVHGGGLGGISVVPEATDVSLGIDQAVAVGMVVGELVSNAFKHAFPGGREGRVTVSMRETGEHGVELIVEDNGVGLPPDVNPESTDTLGLKLVSATATDELGGTLEINRGDGTKFTLRFKNRAS